MTRALRLFNVKHNRCTAIAHARLCIRSQNDQILVLYDSAETIHYSHLSNRTFVYANPGTFCQASLMYGRRPSTRQLELYRVSRVHQDLTVAVRLRYTLLEKHTTRPAINILVSHDKAAILDRRHTEKSTHYIARFIAESS